MSETADVLSELPVIILFSFWWALLSMLEFLSTQGQTGNGSDAAAKTGDATAIPGDDALPELREADPQFSAADFLQGACRAYEEILSAYALCDVKALQSLLSAEVLRAFTDALAARAAREETLELTFIGILSAEIDGIAVRPEAIEIAVLFRAQVVQAERSAAGNVICGDPTSVATVADVWTFSCPRPVNRAAWTVIATDELAEAA